ncbi:hypothetical protein AAZX31_18G277000 [Glycine max]
MKVIYGKRGRNHMKVNGEGETLCKGLNINSCLVHRKLSPLLLRVIIIA